MSECNHESTHQKYICTVHGEIGVATMNIYFDGVQYGKNLCAKCWWDFMSANVNEAKAEGGSSE